MRVINDFSLEKWNGQAIILYGLGDYGSIICDYFLEKNIDIKVIDNGSAGSQYKSLDIKNKDIINEYKDANYIIGSSKYCVEIYEDIASKGIDSSNIYSAIDIFSEQELKENKGGFLDVVFHHGYRIGFQRLLAYLNDGWIMHHATVTVTEKCTLKCEKCVSFMPQYKAPKNCNEKDTMAALDRIFKSNCFLNEMVFVGGEPLINQEMVVNIINRYKDSRRYATIQIITNGTIIPGDILLEALKPVHERVMVLFSNYGELSRNQKEAVEKFESIGVFCAVEQDADLSLDMGNAWIDYGDVIHYKRTEEEYQELYENCGDGKSCTTIMNGYMYICPRIAHSSNLGMYPAGLYREKFNLLDKDFDELSPEELREKIQLFYEDTKHPGVCEYCIRDKKVLVERAKQLEL